MLEQEALQKNGYVILKNVFEKDSLHFLRDLIKSNSLDAPVSSEVPRLNVGSDIIYNPFLYNVEFLRLFFHPRIYKIMNFALRDEWYKGLEELPTFILRSMICRSSKDKLPWHIDSFIPYSGSYISTIQVVIPLEPFLISCKVFEKHKRC